MKIFRKLAECFFGEVEHPIFWLWTTLTMHTFLKADSWAGGESSPPSTSTFTLGGLPRFLRT